MNDEKLLLYYYDDGLEPAERQEIMAELEANPLLRARYEQLQRELDSYSQPEPVAVPEHVSARWHDSIDREARLEAQRTPAPKPGFHLGSFFLGTAITAVLVAGIGIGYFLRGGSIEEAPLVPVPMVVDTGTPADSSNAFTRGLQVHFRQSREDLDRLPGYSSAEREMLILQILQQNRLFARAAIENDAPELARVLRAFEPVLTRLAANDLPPGEAARLQAKLAFELNVMLTKLNREPSNSTEST